MSLQQQNRHKDSKGNSLLLGFLYEFQYIPPLSLYSTVSLLARLVTKRYDELNRESGENPVVGFLLRGHWSKQSLFIPEKHFVDMKGVIKLRRTSARDFE